MNQGPAYIEVTKKNRTISFYGSLMFMILEVITNTWINYRGGIIRVIVLLAEYIINIYS